ncbi:ABC transporter ATP-binding protein [Vulcanibacillus modesticaldus]|uniref:ABC transporter ATP-binding protein n=1 Tax=Vulcanibacillus modesticaldus TaxID=337097 RepID=A0A1D2YX78_9BACI|nr:ABC transporter ATP-binding protein [Vulcanibacillus modesticaldus]OEG00361.1 ABC transporter ATP-binding protein [Vulcanibacillus modesticaldus]
MSKNHVVLSVNNLSKTYKGVGYEVKALKNVSFDLYKGELLAVMGTSGSGKSTLLSIIGALDEPNEGTITLNGEVNKNMFTEPYATDYRRENIGFIFQSFNLLKDLTVEENIALPLILKGTEEEEIDEQVQQMLELVGLTDWRSHRPVQLSGGQQQRVAIGRALIIQPPIVLADEPTGNLDFNTSTDILNVLVDMKNRFNQSIIMVTHDPYVAAYADRVLFFHDGQIVDLYKCTDRQKNMDNILKKFRR